MLWALCWLDAGLTVLNIYRNNIVFKYRYPVATKIWFVKRISKAGRVVLKIGRFFYVLK
jgi:hypothetical protein